MPDISYAHHILVAMPGVQDPIFERSVIYVCEHHDEGAIGLMINKPMTFSLGFVFEQLHITSDLKPDALQPLLFGGPVQSERGFVIHKPEGKWRTSLLLQDDITITTSNDIIYALARNEGPEKSLITLGYSAWAANQLDEEVKRNDWLVCPFNEALLYEVPLEARRLYAGQSIGVNIDQISSSEGHA